jgi:hypothetical protein
MRKPLLFAMALALSSPVLGQQPQAKRESPSTTSTTEQSAAARGSGARCDLMSREEMLMCRATKPGDVSGVRSSLCDTVSANTIDACLRQQESVSSDPANEFRNRRDARAAPG